MSAEDSTLQPKENAKDVVFSKCLISSIALAQVISEYQHLYTFTIKKEDEKNFYVQIENKVEKHVTDSFCEKFTHEVSDQEIRIDLQNRFGQLRDIIVRYAFFPAEDDND